MGHNDGQARPLKAEWNSHMFKPLGPEFFQGSALELAPRLPGIVMVRRIGNVVRRARLVEVEAYLGPKDLASHASRGLTARTKALFGPPGRSYVYFIYGMHWMFNIVVGQAGGGQAILVRAAEPLGDWHADLSGPGKLARAFGITREHHDIDLANGEIFFVREPDYQPRIVKTKRIGVDYAKHWKNRLLRFVDMNNPVAKKLR
jgi:DNA-3-methyladenine glycosylase